MKRGAHAETDASGPTAATCSSEYTLPRWTNAVASGRGRL